MKVIIDIPEELCKNKKGYLTTMDAHMICNAVANGTPLPKKHGRLIDAKVAYRKFYSRCYGGVAEEILNEVPTIIEADNAENKEYGVKVINRGNCMLCGKKLTEGLLFCKECEAKGK